GGPVVVEIVEESGRAARCHAMNHARQGHRRRQNPAKLGGPRDQAFSSYSMSMDLVIKAGYWDDDVIPEDSRFYWKSFFATHGRLKVVPIFLPIYGDAPEASDRGMPWERVKTHANQYNQIKRWAWGVSDVPYVTVRLLRHAEISLWLRAR